MRNVLLFLLILSLPAPGQRRRGEELDILNAAVATFDGTLRSLTKKELVIELAGDQSLTFEVNKKTQFLRGAKPMAAKDVRVGALVLVEARKVASDLIAVRVRVKDPEA